MERRRNRIGRSRSAGMLALFAAALAVVAGAGCGGDDGGGDATATPTTRPTAAAPTPLPGASQAATLKGRLTLDGEPLESDFLGVQVVRDGLVTACQNEIPSVALGYYEIDIAADGEVKGCGADGAQLLLWGYHGDGYVFTSTTAPWPGNGATTTFDGTMSLSDPAGASKPVTAFKGSLFGSDGLPMPGGTVVEAYVGDVLCGVTSLRRDESTEGLYVLAVVGPDSVAGCSAGGTIRFELDGRPAKETATNDLGIDVGSGSRGHELDLSIQ